MSSKQNLKVQLRRMWAEDPKCRRCGVETVLLENTVNGQRNPPPNLATLDHRFTRYQHQRRDPGPFSHRLLCRRCNHELGREVEAAVSIEELRERSRRHGGRRRRLNTRLSAESPHGRA